MKYVYIFNMCLPQSRGWLEQIELKIMVLGKARLVMSLCHAVAITWT